MSSPLLLVACCCPWLTLVGARADAPGQRYWQDRVARGVLDGEFLSHLACEGGPQGDLWDDFRSKFQAHVESGAWDIPGIQWVTDGSTWSLIKAAEEVMETWRRTDLKMTGDNSSVSETLSAYTSRAAKTPMRGRGHQRPSLADPAALAEVRA